MNSKDEPQQARTNSRGAGATFQNLFHGVAVWRKIARGAIVTPLMLLVGAIVGRLMKDVPGKWPFKNDFLDDPNFALMLFCCVGVGAAVGGLLALKEVAASQWNDPQGPSPFMRALFGFGRWSLLLFWIPITIAITFYLVIGMPA